MKTGTAWIVYSLLRLTFFALPFAALMLIGWKWWFAAIVATLVSVSLSVIFLSRPRETAAKGVYDWRNRDRTVDDIAEDAAVDSAASEATVIETRATDPARATEIDDSGSANSDPRA